MDTVTLSTRAIDEFVVVAIPATVVLSRESLLELVRDLLRAGRKIFAIKIVRATTGHGLLLSKTIVDNEEAKLMPEKETW